MKLCLLSSGCESRSAKGEPTRAGGKPGVGPAFVQKITGVGESVSGNHSVRSFRTYHQSDRVFRIQF